MSDQTTNTVPNIDPVLLAKLTGGLGDQATVAKRCSALGHIFSEFLPDVIKAETGLDISVAYIGCEAGLMNDIIADLGENFALVNGSLRNWSPTFVLACCSGVVLTLMEHLLGALPETIKQPVLRPLSVIELDLSVMVFDKLANVLRSGVNASGGFEPLLGAPHNIESRPKHADDHVDEFAAAVKMTMTVGMASSEFVVIVPQKVLLKTDISAPRAKIQATKSDAWSEQLSEQVRRSQVTLDARIKLQSLTLATVSKLAVGDVIPFMDSQDVHVEVSANGKELYVCEFGRSGENYTVRVKDNINSDDELLRHLMN
ncbi:FliM/FliN family flagellar motor switch protein [Rhizobium tubonense]|uniref:Flagellar motor switch protein FliM n=1 Tax=Rhizobium tubonense TaxID=484088 RepID=A0A2W4CGX7_9HYPH|nr:FliM/FliN family flagellar motor switch protein [Rhizobium tubonense]PZM12317.1 flagellar motor switch protein FliM [Rhizobium tubonense]